MFFFLSTERTQQLPEKRLDCYKKDIIRLKILFLVGQYYRNCAVISLQISFCPRINAPDYVADKLICNQLYFMIVFLLLQIDCIREFVRLLQTSTKLVVTEKALQL